jgi:hypothetical protein
MIGALAWLTLLQLPVICFCPAAYRQRRRGLALFNRATRFVIISIFLMCPVSVPQAGPGAPDLPAFSSLFVLPISMLQQPLLYTVPVAAHFPLLFANLLQCTCFW